MKPSQFTVTIVVCLLLVLGSIPAQNPSQFNENIDAHQQLRNESLENQILSRFSENIGQIQNKAILFYEYLPDGYIGFGQNCIILWQEKMSGPIDIIFNTTRQVNPIGLHLTRVSTNYFLGSRGTFVGVKSYSTLVYNEIWAGIDLRFHTAEDGIKCEFYVKSHADTSAISVSATGPNGIPVDPTSLGILQNYRMYQEEETETNQRDTSIGNEVVRYSLSNIGLSIADYDKSKALTIDSLLFSTYLGGSDGEFGNSVAVDSSGNIYLTGYTFSFDFTSATEEYLFPNRTYYSDCFVAKLSENELEYIAYVGGNGGDFAYAMTIDDSGNAFVTGKTESYDFPIVDGFDNTLSFHDCFVFKLSPEGDTLLYSTFVGGSGIDHGNAIAVDSQGNIYVTGNTVSSDFPTKSAFDTTFNGESYPTGDCFVFKLNTVENELVFSTYFGGPGADEGLGLVIDDFGNSYVTGWTHGGVPTVRAFDNTHNGMKECFVFKLNSSGDGLTFSTYIGGSRNDLGQALAIDSTGNVYITGNTL
ncbi:MAG: SBBP repeat-containing protein, partial [Candidatus Thorarchaeota archaeon]